jgi:hypothetical protein
MYILHIIYQNKMKSKSLKTRRVTIDKRKNKNHSKTKQSFHNFHPECPILKPDIPAMVVTPLFPSLKSNMHLDDNFTLDENTTWNHPNYQYDYNVIEREYNEIDIFVDQFTKFQYENDIGDVSETMNPEKWIDVDTFIFKYIYDLACQNKLRKVIYDYGIANGMVRLFDFYKRDLCINIMQSDSEILEYISKQTNESINTDMVLAILRESIGFNSFKSFILN